MTNVNKAGLTPKQAEVLRVIRQFEETYDYTPSIDELAGLTGRTRTPTHSLLQQLERRGYISRTPGSARSIKLL